MPYATLEQARDFGITVAMVSDADFPEVLELWSRVIDRACGQWFEPREVTARFDGNARDEIHLDVPIIAITSLRINGSTTDLDAADFYAYSSRSIPDDRQDPRVALEADVFERGRKNQVLVGVFGFVDGPDDAEIAELVTPAPIRRAVLKLMREKLQEELEAKGEADEDKFVGQGPVIEEVTDSHSRKWGNPFLKATRPGTLAGITSDPEINRIVMLYRRPMIVGIIGGGWDQ